VEALTLPNRRADVDVGRWARVDVLVVFDRDGAL
jgi:hypothetical protein